jgi:WD40 repeat protein
MHLRAIAFLLGYTSVSHSRTFVLTRQSGSVRALAISPDGQTLVSGSEDKTIKIWQLSTGQELRTLTGNSSGIHALAISPDGRTIVSGSGDKTIKIWQLSTGQNWVSLQDIPVAFVPLLSVPMDKRWLVVVTTRPSAFGGCCSD